ncbi:hypothetical protein [Shewanella algae]
MEDVTLRKFLGNIYKNKPLAALAKLDEKTRNSVRAIYSSNENEAIKIINKLRKKLSPAKIIDMEKAITALHNDKDILPESFPSEPQTHEKYIRLENLDLIKQIQLIELKTKEKQDTLKNLCNSFKTLNSLIIDKNYSTAIDEVEKIINEYGFSHYLLRKITLLKELCDDEEKTNFLLTILNEATSKSKIITASLMHCFQEEQDYLGIKRSIMSLSIRGNYNQFTRDISRIPFHPHAKNTKDLEEMLQSNLQSSIIDAIIILKVNRKKIKHSNIKSIETVFRLLEEASPRPDDIIGVYFDGNSCDREFLFLKHSSAWMENDEINQYKYLIDHFYDSPESEYFELSEEVINNCSKIVNCNTSYDLITSDELLITDSSSLKVITKDGYILRTAIFNYLVFTKKCEFTINENDLYPLMTKTNSLDRTIHVPSMKTILPVIQSPETKLILRLLIAKKSKSEIEQMALKSLIEKILISNYEGNLVLFISEIAKKSEEVAFYIYETCNEDFIARMTRVTDSVRKITETRANLHNWRGIYSGEQIYLDRARNLIIDNQINKIRGEIDDNRIYVDTTRFSEWYNDHIYSQISSTLLILEHSNDLDQIDNPQLFELIEKCFHEFCTNSFFGIASYLGRRIRHGTFRGHLYSEVTNNIQKKHKDILQKLQVETVWNEWKEDYENKISTIINDRLHVNTPKMKLGFLIPNLKDSRKQKITLKCISSLIENYQKSGNIYGCEGIVIDACWRIAEVDLKSFISFMKSQKTKLFNRQALINLNTQNLTSKESNLVLGFERDLQSSITDKLNTLCGWFKKPQSVSPKASVSLLYKAVASEVQQSFELFEPDTDFEEENDIELNGGVYHIFYDALYVIIFNAAKHGKVDGTLSRSIFIETVDNNKKIHFKILSEIADDECEDYVSERLKVYPNDDLNNAQIVENRSGIKKLYNLELVDKNFCVELIACRDRKVITEFSYQLGY